MIFRCLSFLLALSLFSCGSSNDGNMPPITVDITNVENRYGDLPDNYIVDAYIISGTLVNLKSHQFGTVPFNEERMAFELKTPPRSMLRSVNEEFSTDGVTVSDTKARWSGEVLFHVYSGESPHLSLISGYLRYCTNSWDDDAFWTTENAFIYYCYVDRDVTISGSLVSGLMEFDLKFSKGWNRYAFYKFREDGEGSEMKIKYSSVLPSGVRWRL